MRILLDAHVSSRVVGARLRQRGHDVQALDEAPELEGLDDEAVLDLASRESRVLVTFNISDFPGILRTWAEADRAHAGAILVHVLRHHEFGLLHVALEDAFNRRPRAED